MKKIISLLICLILLVGIAIPAYATNVDAIQPSGNVYIIGVTDQDVPIIGTLPTYNAGPNTFVIIPGERLEGTWVNPITNRPVENTTTNTETATETTKIDNSEITIPTDASKTEQIIPEELQKQIFELTNKQRVAYELPELTYNTALQTAADIRAKEISESFSHTRPNGTNCDTVVSDIDYFVTGENLIMADNPIATAEKMMDSWMNSQGHKDNILLADFESMAVGIYEKDNVTYAVQIFIG